MLGQVITLELTAFFIILGRIGGALMILPGFSAPQIPPRMRVMMAALLTLVVMPVVAPLMQPLPDAIPGLTLMLGGEILIGVFLGSLGSILMSALHTSGVIGARAIGMANALTNDPVSAQQGSVLSAFLSVAALALVFTMDLHHLMVEAVVSSYEMFRPGEVPSTGDAALMMTRWVADSFRMGIQIASPLIVFNLVFYVGLGLLTRLMPRVPLFFVALPLILGLGMWLLALVIAPMMRAFAEYFESGLLDLIGG